MPRGKSFRFASAIGRLSQLSRGSVSLFVAALREVFDESAYARFLQRNALSPSRRSYAEFLNENEQGKARRPRCC
jgi:hypothetical protein